MIVNEVSYDGTTTEEWKRPELEDFGYADRWSELSETQKKDVISHFLVTTGTDGNPPGDYEPLKLPVVEAGSNMLNKHGLDSAKAYLSKTEGLTENGREKVRKKISDLQKKEFGEGE
ncbi:MAG: hypothetical protein ABEK59_12645 [Halobacteria archaeon]